MSKNLVTFKRKSFLFSLITSAFVVGCGSTAKTTSNTASKETKEKVNKMEEKSNAEKYIEQLPAYIAQLPADANLLEAAIKLAYTSTPECKSIDSSDLNKSITETNNTKIKCLKEVNLKLENLQINPPGPTADEKTEQRFRIHVYLSDNAQTILMLQLRNAHRKAAR
ncbi:MAG: hypothetical protein R3B45_03680 [Bdellovibrionota bacterium]